MRYRWRVTHVALPSTPLAPGAGPVALYVRDHRPADAGGRLPLLVLHGGWGYEIYAFAAQLPALADRRVVIPDRTGYGRSPALAALPPRFHQAAAEEHLATLDALAVDRCAIWGHSDGAVIAAIMALRWPARVAGVILEALHVDRDKPRSRAFFETMRDRPDDFGPRVTARLAADHGEPRWRDVLRCGGRAWLDIAATPDDDFYDHRLADLAVPALVLHGADDPRSEPDELARIARALPAATVHVIAGAGHAPHSERAAAAEATAVGVAFVRGLDLARR